MSKVFIEETTLTAIGEAIRGKTGKEDLISPLEMPEEINSISGAAEPVLEALSVTVNGSYTPEEGVDGFNLVEVNVPTGGGGLPEGALELTGVATQRFCNDGWNWFIDAYGSQITTKDMTDPSYMFYNSVALESVPFKINLKKLNGAYNVHSMNYMFNECNKLKVAPDIDLGGTNMGSMNTIFYNCQNLKYLPKITNFNVVANTFSNSSNNGCYNCYSLRSMDGSIYQTIFSYGRAITNKGSIYGSNVHYYGLFESCASLDEVKNLSVLHFDDNNYSVTANMFNNSFKYCFRLKEMTFEVQADGTPYSVRWSGQTIDLSNCTGWCYASTSYRNRITNYNSGITADKKVTDLDSFNNIARVDPDWWTDDMTYSRYNKKSAINTINSLPDTSAFLASNGGTNTIKFKSMAGDCWDGNATSSSGGLSIGTMTEAEIAVATAKGWTVSFVN